MKKKERNKGIKRDGERTKARWANVSPPLTLITDRGRGRMPFVLRVRGGGHESAPNRN
jgi:hypothetical protein